MGTLSRRFPRQQGSNLQSFRCDMEGTQCSLPGLKIGRRSRVCLCCCSSNTSEVALWSTEIKCCLKPVTAFLPPSSLRLPSSAGRGGRAGAHHFGPLARHFQYSWGILSLAAVGATESLLIWLTASALGERAAHKSCNRAVRGPRRPVSRPEHLLSSFSAASLSHSISFFSLCVCVRTRARDLCIY